MNLLLFFEASLKEKKSLSPHLPNPRKNQPLKIKDITPPKKTDESKFSSY